MAHIFALVLLILFIQLGIGGGLYETLVIYPRWRKGVTPSNLLQKLGDSGQLTANKRYWPLVSPAQVLLSIVNMVMAWQDTGRSHTTWLAAALIVFINRVITFSYFIPVMIRKFQHPENIDETELKRSVHLWTMLSPVRIAVEFAGWCFAMYALVLMGCG